MDPLTEPQIHRAIRALDAGDRPDGATIKTALLMALAWHAAQAEIVALRAALGELHGEVYAAWLVNQSTSLDCDATLDALRYGTAAQRARALLTPNGARP